MADGSLKSGKLSTVRTVMNQTLTNVSFPKEEPNISVQDMWSSGISARNLP